MYKVDFEPLLSAGRHEMCLESFRKRFVDPLGGGRQEIWKSFCEQIAEPIKELGIPCEIWIDGSFITRSPSPSDIDGSLMVEVSVIRDLSLSSIKFLESFDDTAPSFDQRLDIFLCPVYPVGHPQRGEYNDPDGWAEQWSKEHNSSWLKGFVVIPFR